MSKYRLPEKPAIDAPSHEWALYHSRAAVVHSNRAVRAGIIAVVFFAIALVAQVIALMLRLSS